MSTLKNWNKIKLKDICNFLNGDAYKDTDWSNTGVPIVRIQNLNDISKPFNYWAGTTEDRITIDNNDLLLAWSGTPGTSFGAHIWNRGFALLNQHIFKVIYDQESANPLFLKYAINQILKIMIDKSHGAVGLRHVTKPEVENLEILLPPLEEQKRIVNIIETKLTAVGKAKMANNEQLSIIEKLLDLYVENIYKNEKWNKVKLGDIAIINPSIRGKILGDNEMCVSFVPMTAVDAMTGTIKNTECKKLSDVRKGYTYFENEDILFAKITPCMENGKSAIARNLQNEIGFGSTEFHVIKATENILPEWVHYYIRQRKYLKDAENYMTGSVGQQRLPDDYLYNTLIPLPPLEEQNEKITMLKQKQAILNNICRNVTEQSSYIDALSLSILRKAFKGEL